MTLRMENLKKGQKRGKVINLIVSEESLRLTMIYQIKMQSIYLQLS